MNNKPHRVWIRIGLLLAALLPLASVQAEYAPAPKRAPAADAITGRVIVKFKEVGAGRASILAAARGNQAPSPAQVHALQQALQQRADALGQRRGFALRSGHALDERTQVVTAYGVASAVLAARLAADPEVEYAMPDGRRHAFRVPDDPLYGPASPPANGPAVGQWYLKPAQASTLSTGSEVLSSINAQGAWDITTGHRSMVVAVLDTGVRYDHPDLAGKLLPGYDMVVGNGSLSDLAVANDGDGRDADASDPGDWVSSADAATSTFADCEVSNSSWHGTQVSGLIAAATNNATGMAGTGWNVRVLPVRVLGKCFGYDSDIIAGMRWAAGLAVPGLPSNPNPAGVLNLSLGADGTCDVANAPAYLSAIADLTAAGAVVVAAAGNSTGHAVSLPANCPGVIGVAALRHIGTKVGFSDVGPELTIAAPGGNCVNTNASDSCLYPLLSTYNTGTQGPAAPGYTDSQHPSVGTSFSAPLVSATIALMRTANRTLTPAQIISTLKSTARPFPTTGAAPDPTESSGTITACQPPSSTAQYQCYCTTSTCGAGMLDTYQAVAAVARLEAYVDIDLAAPQPGQALTLSAGSSVVPPGRSITSRTWSIVSDGGIVPASTTSSGPTMTITPTAAGSFTVRLALTDSTGAQSTTDQVVTVSTPDTGEGGGGGGAASLLWSGGLLAAAAALRRRRR
jgi:serine protease